MVTLLLIGLALACSTAYARPRIVNGVDAGPNEFPHQVSIAKKYYGNWYHTCGAVVVGTRWVATAAHCVDTSNVQSVQLVIGEHNRYLNDGETNVTVDSIFVHEQWGSSGPGVFPYDIAVMKTNTPIAASRVIRMATAEDEKNFIGEKCAISGWGLLEGSGSTHHILQKTYGTVMLKEQCSKEGKWPLSNFNDGHICVVEPTTGACNGDSGGPLTCGTGDSKRLLGVTSWGYNGCRTDYASVYTRISHYSSWIQGIINDNS